MFAYTCQTIWKSFEFATCSKLTGTKPKATLISLFSCQSSILNKVHILKSGIFATNFEHDIAKQNSKFENISSEHDMAIIIISKS